MSGAIVDPGVMVFVALPTLYATIGLLGLEPFLFREVALTDTFSFARKPFMVHDVSRARITQVFFAAFTVVEVVGSWVFPWKIETTIFRSYRPPLFLTDFTEMMAGGFGVPF